MRIGLPRDDELQIVAFGVLEAHVQQARVSALPVRDCPTRALHVAEKGLCVGTAPDLKYHDQPVGAAAWRGRTLEVQRSGAAR